jgi:hypothetical protein
MEREITEARMWEVSAYIRGIFLISRCSQRNQEKRAILKSRKSGKEKIIIASKRLEVNNFRYRKIIKEDNRTITTPGMRV